MVVSSFCSHQCSGHSICPTKCLAWVWKRFCLSATLEISKEYWGWSRAPVVRIRCLICPLEWEITPPCWIQSRGLVAWVITQGEMQQEAGAAGMCTYVPYHMVIFVREARKIHSPCKCGSVTICGTTRGALHTFNSVNGNVIDRYTLSFNKQGKNMVRNTAKLGRDTLKKYIYSTWTFKGMVHRFWEHAHSCVVRWRDQYPLMSVNQRRN